MVVEFSSQQLYMALLLALSSFLMGVKAGLFISWLFSKAEEEKKRGK